VWNRQAPARVSGGVKLEANGIILGESIERERGEG